MFVKILAVLALLIYRLTYSQSQVKLLSPALEFNSLLLKAAIVYPYTSLPESLRLSFRDFFEGTYIPVFDSGKPQVFLIQIKW